MHTHSSEDSISFFVRRPVQVMSPLVAERIAAGEVVERPASVVKELVENSLDAGATRIHVHLEDGGRGFIEVIDNGSGMSEQDLSQAFLRHATSKLIHFQDLETLSTLGFRGEALPSIAAVAEVEILSAPVENKTHGGAVSSVLIARGESQMEAGAPIEFLSARHGTRVRVRNLFAEVPVRLKFLKSNSAEVSACREIIERLALVHPQCEFSLLHEGKRVFHVVPSTLDRRVAQIISPTGDYTLVHHELSSPQGRASLYWAKGASVGLSKKFFQFLNGRPLRDRLIGQAIAQSFKQNLLPGQYPVGVLFLEMDPSEFDVNVHPNKTEVRFVTPGKIYERVHQLVQETLRVYGGHRHIGDVETPAFSWSQSPSPKDDRQSSSSAQYASATTLGALEPYVMGSDPKAPTETVPPVVESKPVVHLGQFIGQLLKTYLAYEVTDGLLLIDQHAAHERVSYEKLQRSWFNAEAAESTPVQQLLVPEMIQVDECDGLGASLRTLVVSTLQTKHFDVEEFGERSIVVRGVPSYFGFENLKIRLANLVSAIAESEQPSEHGTEYRTEYHTERLPGGRAVHSFDERVFERLASQSCRSSIKAGDELPGHVLQDLAQQLMKCDQPWSCPHGRPTTVVISRDAFDEWFLRQAPARSLQDWRGDSTFAL